MIDILEQEIADMSKALFNVLLKDRTTKKNICWATDQFISLGSDYYPQEPITQNLITKEEIQIIQPRVSKAIEEQNRRTKEKAEVFTPSWICNEQNNLVDETWFGRKNVFSISTDQSWTTVEEKISFPEGKTWKSYVDARRLEISCGEAPYLVSRYDTVTGQEISIENRIGLLDRKLRIVNENTTTEDEWLKWVTRAYESTYGYEYQGDNILIARENLLYTFIENMQARWGIAPNDKQLNRIARIISWNIWQMDGITMTVPYSERPSAMGQITLFDSMDGAAAEKEAIPCRIYDWRADRSLEFKSLIKGESS
ncbi:MAG: restriction endonuclease subunit M [Christensenella sp.]|uniref:restriction endonuclease subunit M n=1 Tax=Christensenella sp. TaxID=1935934 RepID=UPI002B20B85C|nr:restriction endonuclease subunit M [Christensenella sp.]MEA5002266.1 restriction endonuclease subunit M [Christensenella sp.]